MNYSGGPISNYKFLQSGRRRKKRRGIEWDHMLEPKTEWCDKKNWTHHFWLWIWKKGTTSHRMHPAAAPLQAPTSLWRFRPPGQGQGAQVRLWWAQNSPSQPVPAPGWHPLHDWPSASVSPGSGSSRNAQHTEGAWWTPGMQQVLDECPWDEVIKCQDFSMCKPVTTARTEL